MKKHFCGPFELILDAVQSGFADFSYIVLSVLLVAVSAALNAIQDRRDKGSGVTDHLQSKSVLALAVLFIFP